MKNFLLLCFSIALSLFISEAILRYVGYWTPISICRAAELSSRGYLLNPVQGEDYPQPTLQSVKYYYYPHHLRGTPLNLYAKKILTLGDSFTFGWLLPQEKTYIYDLQKKADVLFGKGSYQFLNAATGGWGTADYLAFLEEHGEEISPEFVLIFLNTDDIGRSLKKTIYQLKDNHSLVLKENFHALSFQNNYVKLFHTCSCSIIKHSELVFFIYEKLQNIFSISSRQNNTFKAQYDIPASADLTFDNRTAQRYGEALFQRINQWCQQHHAKLIVVTTGFNAFYPASMHDPTKVFLDVAGAFFEKENIPYYDIAPLYKKAVLGTVFQIPHDHHPNMFGGKMIAEISWPWIKKQIKKEKLSN
jgi:hypothetical protein